MGYYNRVKPRAQVYSLSQYTKNMVQGTSASASHGSLLEMPNLGPYPRAPVSESVF